MKKTRIFATLLCIVMLIGVASACNNDTSTSPSASSPSESSAAPSQSSAPPSETPGATVTHDTLNIVATSDDGTLRHEDMQGDMFSGIQLVNEPLWGQIKLIAPDVEFILAESFEQPALTEMIIHLKQGIKFSNGNPFTASDVLFSIRTQKASLVSGSSRGQLMNPDKSSIIDDYTLNLVWDDYHIGQTGIIASVMMVDEESYDPEVASTKPIGTGPYVVSEYVLNSHLFLEKRDDYWRDEAPEFKYINFRVLAEPAQQINALETGLVDLAFRIPNEDAEHVKSLPNMNVLSYYDTQYVQVRFNMAPASQLNSLEARLAICHAIDKQAIVDVVYIGMAQVLHRMAPLTIADDQPGLDDLSEIYSIGYDVELAKKYAEEAGIVGKTIKLMNNGTAEVTLLSEMVQDMMKEIGVNAQIVSYDSATTWSRGFDDVNAEFWEMAVGIGINPGYSSAGGLVMGFLVSPIMNTPGHWPAVEEYASAAVGFFGTVDPQERLAKVKTMMRLSAEYALGLAVCDIQRSTALADWIDPDSFILGQNGEVCLRHMKSR